MNTVNLSIQKDVVYDEVQKTTNYIGAKADDTSVWDRVRTIDEDSQMLERYWLEAADMATDLLKPFVTVEADSAVSETIPAPPDMSATYSVTLSMPDEYDTNLNRSLESSLYHFFEAAIIAKWLRLVSPDTVAPYEADMARHTLDIRSKLYFRKPPVRTPHNNS